MCVALAMINNVILIKGFTMDRGTVVRCNIVRVGTHGAHIRIYCIYAIVAFEPIAVDFKLKLFTNLGVLWLQ